jgi:UDP-N-acetylmuramate dehydrogenase
VESLDELEYALTLLWKMDAPVLVLGGGSNVLVSDTGVRGVVIINRARQVRFDEQDEPPTVWAASGTNFGMLARQAAARGLAGLEWACGIPGTLGGAVVGNAGAHSGDMAGNLLVAEILQRGDKNISIRERWTVERMAYEYRSSLLKHKARHAVVLSAVLRLSRSMPGAVQAKIDEYTEYRHRTQPPGASMGSMFKNPPGDYAGRLIDAAGLKGLSIGEAQINKLHANFFVNHGNANAQDIFALIQIAQSEVARKFGVDLELEIELVGEWP